MTINSSYSPELRPINPSRVYNFNFQAITGTVYVFEVDADGVQTPASNISIVYNGSAPIYDGGQITFNDPHTAGTVNVLITRSTDQTQLVDFQPYSDFPAESNEFALDKLTLIDQENTGGTGGGGGGGDIDGATNIGAGEGLVFSQEVNGELQFRTLRAGSSNVTITTGANEVTIDAVGGGGPGDGLARDGSETMQGDIRFESGLGSYGVVYQEGTGTGMGWGTDSGNLDAVLDRTIDGGASTKLRMWEQTGTEIQFAVGETTPSLADYSWRFKDSSANFIGYGATELDSGITVEWLDRSNADELQMSLAMGIDDIARLQSHNGAELQLSAQNGATMTLGSSNISTNSGIALDYNATSLPGSLTMQANSTVQLTGLSARLGTEGSAEYIINALNGRASVNTTDRFTVSGGDLWCGSGVAINIPNASHQIRYASVPGGGSGLTLSSNGGTIQMSTIGIYLNAQANSEVVNSPSDPHYATAFNPPISDRRLKENIETLQYGLQEIVQLRSCTFDIIDGERGRWGYIAQEVEEIMPELVVPAAEEGYLTVQESRVVPVLVNAIQDLASENVRMRDRLTSLEDRLAILEGSNV